LTDSVKIRSKYRKRFPEKKKVTNSGGPLARKVRLFLDAAGGKPRKKGAGEKDSHSRPGKQLT
jgi:hypothetical protein